MTKDATRKGVSAEADDVEHEIENEGVDNDAGKQEDHSLPSEHPAQKRQDLYSRFTRERAEAVEDAGEDELENEEEEEQEPDESEDPPKLDTDSLDAYVVLKDGKPYFKTVVDGETKLVSMDRAQAQLQKHEAADVRLQQASELRKSLDAKAEQLKLAEREKQRSPSQQDVNAEDDEALLEEASGLIKSMMDEDEVEAAKKLAASLKKARSTGAQVDMEALVDKVAEATTLRLQGSETQNAIAEGFNAYMKEYADTPVETDPALRAWHTAKVDELIAANPDWSPKQAMLKAGEMACEFAGIKIPEASETITADPPAEKADGSVSKPNPRQDRKRNLQPIPESQSAVSTLKGNEAEPQSARKVVEEMRRVRGQPVGAG